MKLRHITAALAIAAGMGTAHAADKIRVGLLSTLSGPGASVGVEIRDGFQLAIKHRDGRLGGLPVELRIADDQQNPDAGRQAADRLLKRDRVDVMTGMAFSNVLLSVMPAVLGSDTVYLSPNTGPADYAGEKCDKNFFAVAWQNEDIPAAVGQFVTDKGHKSVFLIAPNYPGGRESIQGFKRLFKGKIAEEVYVKLGQLDYSAELARLRASGADAAFFFLPGGMGISFIKQMGAAGLNQSVTLYAPGFSGDQDTIRSVGESMLGMYNASQWAADLPGAANQRFVEDFEKTYGRIPTLYASQGYDAAMLLDGAVRAVGGRIEDKPALRKALRSAPFESVRGSFRFNRNQYPIQDFHLRMVARDERGRLTNKTLKTILKDYQDPFASTCKLP